MPASREASCSTKRRGNGKASSYASPPPSTTSAAPVIQLDIGLTRNKTVLAMSSGQPTIGGFPHERLHVLAKLSAFAEQHGSFHVSRAHTVHADVVLAMVDGHGTRQIDGATFGSAVGRGPRPSLDRPSRTDVDDAASAVAHHVGHDFAREQIDSLERHIEGEVPFVLGKFDDVKNNI